MIDFYYGCLPSAHLPTSINFDCQRICRIFFLFRGPSWWNWLVIGFERGCHFPSHWRLRNGHRLWRGVNFQVTRSSPDAPGCWPMMNRPVIKLPEYRNKEIYSGDSPSHSEKRRGTAAPQLPISRNHLENQSESLWFHIDSLFDCVFNKVLFEKRAQVLLKFVKVIFNQKFATNPTRMIEKKLDDADLKASNIQLFSNQFNSIKLE